MNDLAKSLSKLICLVMVKTGGDGKMFGTVTSGMIADQLKTQFDVTLDKRKIHLDIPSARWAITRSIYGCISVVTNLKVRAETSTPPPAPPASTRSGWDEGRAKTEKRGRRPEAAGDKASAGDKKPYGPRPHRRQRPS